MTAGEINAAIETLFGKRGGQTAMARWLGIDKSTVRRYQAGELPVPGPVKRAIECRLALETGRGEAA